MIIDNKFIFGFISCLFVFTLMGLSQRSNRYNNDRDIGIEFNNLFSNVQPKQFTIATTTPTSSNLQEGQIFIINSNNSQCFITRIGTNTYRTGYLTKL